MPIMDVLMTNDPNHSARCPHCGTSLDSGSAMAIDPARNPAHGDLAVCFSCATLLEFSEDTYLLASPARFAEIPQGLLNQIENTLHRKVRTVPA